LIHIIYLLKQKTKIKTEIDNSNYWMKLAEQGLVPFNAPVPFKPAQEKGSEIKTSKYLANLPDIAVVDISTVVQSENSIFVDPNDNQHAFHANDSSKWSGGTVTIFYGSNYLYTADNEQNWTGSRYVAGGSNSGDTATCLGLNGIS
jgi:hypothetical protein